MYNKALETYKNSFWSEWGYIFLKNLKAYILLNLLFLLFTIINGFITPESSRNFVLSLIILASTVIQMAILLYDGNKYDNPDSVMAVIISVFTSIFIGLIFFYYLYVLVKYNMYLIGIIGMIISFFMLLFQTGWIKYLLFFTESLNIKIKMPKINLRAILPSSERDLIKINSNNVKQIDECLNKIGTHFPLGTEQLTLLKELLLKNPKISLSADKQLYTIVPALSDLLDMFYKSRSPEIYKTIETYIALLKDFNNLLLHQSSDNKIEIYNELAKKIKNELKN